MRRKSMAPSGYMSGRMNPLSIKRSQPMMQATMACPSRAIRLPTRCPFLVDVLSPTILKCGNALSFPQVQGLSPWLGCRGLVPDWGAGLAPLGLWAKLTLVSLCVPEVTTAAAETLVAGESEVAVSAHTLLETQEALERKRKTSSMTARVVTAFCSP